MCIEKPYKLIKRKQLKYQERNLSLDIILNRLNCFSILNKYALKVKTNKNDPKMLKLL